MTKQEKKLVRKAMSLIGSITTEKKAKSSRENGKKGGRPKRKDDCQDVKAEADGEAREDT